ncbi:XdhC family protein [Haladaptatus halobius]|uniref:XdhC family protein n=1 Tax=Haladaptatus halobius TaxID=2884875 RepID=UPI001D0A124F|nr:XdhC/CoxI family protein [Haladaptatus halobius]
MTTRNPDPWSVTALDVQERLQEIRDIGATAAIATVVDVRGSAYRRSGAKMVLTPEGDQFGGITAGCLEGPVGELADRVFETEQSVLERFDLVDDDEWGIGLGCNGVIDVLVEPVDDGWDAALAALASGAPAVTATIVASMTDWAPVGARSTFHDGGIEEPNARPGLPHTLLEAVQDPLEALCGSDGTELRTVDLGGDEVRVFLDGVRPPSRLLIFGGQPDTLPVARLARQVGFRVEVATGRGARADPERFPPASKVFATHPDKLAEHVDARTFVVVMTHNLLDDELALASLADTEIPYFGLMGPRERFEKIRADLRDDGIELPDGFLDRVATPVGLDLGGGEPVEIALSIVAEIVAVENGREGGRLREREGPIHGERTPLSGD